LRNVYKDSEWSLNAKWTFSGSKRTDGGVEARLRHADGREETVSANWLLGCDGAHSVVRHTLAAPSAGATLKSDWMLADVHMKGYPFPDTEASVYWHKDGAFVIFPIIPGRYRVLADLPMTSGEVPPTPTLEQMQAIIDRRGPGGLTAFDPIWLAGFRINGRKVADYRSGHIFLLGDAAHVHSPAGGQGMNTGMQDAFNLAWKLALVIRNSCAEHLLDSYSPERSGVGDEVLKQAGRLTAVGTLKNSTLQSIPQSCRSLYVRDVRGPACLRRFYDRGGDRLSKQSIKRAFGAGARRPRTG
jgi:2-polyprenyl-6-methoxyphenol hydroxylase-like FAD-dependent oxidoreductase